MTTLPDQHYINEIRKRLWSGGVHGQASVMVGAGFSRNAQKITPDGPEFPLWWELGSEMYKALNPGKEISSSIDPLRLATEYEASFGREALNQFLTQIIPDAQHSPDRLHELLMSLPWSDIYTTNYDTLLERTRQKIHDKKYDVIYSSADIPGKEKPRIVKLHGSFPSHRPFIFTEEDYRTYPQKFAPFVNMVQQSIMENIFCLIGFSGDDPNFLNWIGWVRDNLGESMPAIYLCGLLNLSDSQKHTLRQKKIITVDISPLFPKEKWIDGAERHAKGLEWFLLNLMYGEPVDVSQWGIDAKMPKSKSAKWKPSSALPQIPDDSDITIASTSNQPNQLIFSSFSESSLEAKLAELDKLYKYWKEERYSYPGWVICPEVNRKNLWRQTKNWVDDIFTLIKDIEYDDQSLVLLYELNWRLEKCLFPLFEEWIEVIDNVVKKFYTYLFSNDINIDQSANKLKLTPKQKERKANSDNYKFSKIELQDAWINLASALMKNAREDHKEQEFKYWKNTLKEIAVLNNELREKWNYEQCLFHLSRFEFDEIKQVLNNWKSSNIFPFWVVKRASILAEIGNIEDALHETERALIDIRTRRASVNEINYSLLSQESYAMVACEYYEKIQDFNSNRMQDTEEIIQKYRSRYKELAFYFCDPKGEFEKLSLYLEKPLPKLQSAERTKRGFYPGTTNRTVNIGNTNNIIEELLPAFQFLRLYEEAGLPIRVGYSTYYAESIIQASKKIASSAPLYAIGMMFRTGQNTSISEWLDLIRINAMPPNHVSYLAKILTQFIKKVYPQVLFILSYTYENQKLILSASLALLILTRLSIQVQEELQIEELVKFTVNCYKNLHIINNNHELISDISELWKVIFYSITESQLSNHLLEFIQLPVPNEKNYSIRDDDAYRWPEPFKNFPDVDCSSFNFINDQDWRSSIRHLIEIINNENNIIARSFAIFRLHILNNRNALNEELKIGFTKALWSQRDQNTELPKVAEFFHRFFLHESYCLSYPVSDSIAVKDIFKNYLISLELPQINLYSYSGIDKHYLQNLIYATRTINDDSDKFIDWKKEEVESLLDKIFVAINQQKDAIISWYKMPFSMRDIQSFLELIGDLLILVILPRIKNSETNIKNKVHELIEILRQISKSSVYAVLPFMLLISPESYDIEDIARNLKQGLFSTDKHLIRQSLEGIYYWVAYANKEQLPEPPEDLFKKLIDVIYSLRQPGLDYSLNYTYLILKKSPNYFQEKDFENISEGLGYLLEETQYPKNWTELDLQDTQSSISNVDKPTYREYSSQLAYQLYSVLKSQGGEIPSVLNTWREESLKDKLPQIRKIWLNQ
jgi:hypothetical protein